MKLMRSPRVAKLLTLLAGCLLGYLGGALHLAFQLAEFDAMAVRQMWLYGQLSDHYAKEGALPDDITDLAGDMTFAYTPSACQQPGQILLTGAGPLGSVITFGDGNWVRGTRYPPFQRE